jgi:hypothetical protein
MTSKLLTLALLLTSTLSAPVADPAPQSSTTSPTKPFTLTIAHNSDTALNGQKINAEGLALYLGLTSPSTFCPTPPVTVCPAGTETAFSGLLSMVS